jgi:hypothetical protein
MSSGVAGDVIKSASQLSPALEDAPNYGNFAMYGNHGNSLAKY